MTRDITYDCQEWDGPSLPSGYGMTRKPHSGHSGPKHYAHRLVWEEAHGPIPPGMYVCHRCDNPPCINIDHLFLGTPADNAGDMSAKGRARGGEQNRRKTHCLRGHPFSGENLAQRKLGRACKACERARMARARQSAREVVA